MHIGSFLIVPLVYALFIAILLRPLVNGLEKYLKWRSLAIFASFILVFIPFSIITGLVSYQLLSIVDGLPSIGDNLKVGIDTLQNALNGFLPPSLVLKPDQLSGQLGNILSGPISILGKGMIISSNILVGMTMTVIYTSFILLYSKSFKNFVIFQYEKMYRTDVKKVLGKIQEIIQHYISGMLLVIVVLSFINSLGLYIIGIEYAIFWGILAGLLAIIPYIGTLIGGLLPFLYALATTGSTWQPIAVLLMYGVVQQLEGNLITPKVVGDKVNVNPFAAIIALLFFGTLWGIGGVILALPCISIIRIILNEFEATKPISILLGADIGNNAYEFKRLAQA